MRTGASPIAAYRNNQHRWSPLTPLQPSLEDISRQSRIVQVCPRTRLLLLLKTFTCKESLQLASRVVLAPQPQGCQALSSPLPHGSVQKMWHPSMLQGQDWGTGKKGPHDTQPLAILKGSARRPCAVWVCLQDVQMLCPLSAPVGHGGAAPCAGSWVGGESPRTPNSPATLVPPPHPGHPRHGMRRGLEPTLGHLSGHRPPQLQNQPYCATGITMTAAS